MNIEMLVISLIPAFVVFLFIIILLSKAVYLVNQSEAIIVERLGRYSKTLNPGLHFLTPFIDVARKINWSYLVPQSNGSYYTYNRNFIRIDLREAVYDFPKQNVITKDNVTMEINALLYYQITDPKAAVYEVLNLPEAIEKLTQTTLRNVIGSMDLDETLVSRDSINEKLRIILDEATDKWGVKVNRVELQEVTPPYDIRIAMEKQMRAERDRRAAILQAEGEKRSAILKAEGLREADILKAEGEAQARILNAESDAKAQVLNAEGEAAAKIKIAEGEAQAMLLIKNASGDKDLMSYLIATNYIKVLPTMMNGKDDKLVVVPYEASSFAGLLSSMKSVFNSSN